MLFLFLFFFVCKREKGAIKGRVFVMGFPGEELEVKNWNTQDPEKYGVMEQHMNTVVANEALVVGYRARFPAVEIYGLNPGMVQTGIRSNVYTGAVWLCVCVLLLSEFGKRHFSIYWTGAGAVHSGLLPQQRRIRAVNLSCSVCGCKRLFFSDFVFFFCFVLSRFWTRMWCRSIRPLCL